MGGEWQRYIGLMCISPPPPLQCILEHGKTKLTRHVEAIHTKHFTRPNKRHTNITTSFHVLSRITVFVLVCH